MVSLVTSFRLRLGAKTMSAVAQIALPFGSEEPFFYHDPTRAGFVSVLQQMEDGTKAQRTFKLEKMAEELAALEGRRDVWIAQNEFFKPNRRVVNLWWLPLAFLDLDTYKVARLNSMSPESLVRVFLQRCEDDNIPQPSVIVFSGRGLQVKWIFDHPLPRRALPRWQAVQRELHRRLADFGSDSQALDASRVLRLVNTTNSRSGEVVRVVHIGRTTTNGATRLPSGLVGYGFDLLADALLPLNRLDLEELEKQRDQERNEYRAAKAAREARKAQMTVVHGGKSKSAAHPNLRTLVPSQLAWDRVADIRKLAELRGYADGFPPGKRDIVMFIVACFLADAVTVADLPSEIRELAGELVPTWTSTELQSCVSSVVTRARQAARGETVNFKGFEVTPRYRWRNSTLVDVLEITAAEEEQMGTIMSLEEAKRRDAKRHRDSRKAAGGRSAAEWNQSREQARVSARLLRAQGMSYPAIARDLGIGVATVHRYCQ